MTFPMRAQRPLHPRNSDRSNTAQLLYHPEINRDSYLQPGSYGWAIVTAHNAFIDHVRDAT